MFNQVTDKGLFAVAAGLLAIAVSIPFSKPNPDPEPNRYEVNWPSESFFFQKNLAVFDAKEGKLVHSSSASSSE